MALKSASKVPKKTAKQFLLRKEALALRAGGAAYEAIAEALGSTYGTVRRACEGAFEALQEEVKDTALQVLPLELMRLDKMWLSHWDKRSDPKHAQILLSIMDRRSRYLSLDAPVKQELSGPGGGPIETFDRTEELMAKLEQMHRAKLQDGAQEANAE